MGVYGKASMSSDTREVYGYYIPIKIFMIHFFIQYATGNWKSQDKWDRLGSCKRLQSLWHLPVVHWNGNEGGSNRNVLNKHFTTCRTHKVSNNIIILLYYSLKKIDSFILVIKKIWTSNELNFLWEKLNFLPYPTISSCLLLKYSNH